MSLPIRPLPAWQNWDCHGCGNCCRDYQVAVTDEERARIAGQGWDKDPVIGDLPLFVRQAGVFSNTYRLNHRSDGTCLFLNDQGRCRIHERFGEDAKPLACRLYPFMLVPAGDGWRVGLRYACPSASANQGGPARKHDLASYAKELAKEHRIVANGVRPPPLQVGQRVEWPDLLRFTEAVLAILKNRASTVERRLRLCLALANVCRQARFDKLSGGRLTEFLSVLSSGVEGEVPRAPSDVPAPKWVGRVLFRQILALYVRKDQGQDQGPHRRDRLGLLRAAWGFARGRGTVPRVHAWLPETTFERVEEPAGPLPEEAERSLERYYCVKVESLQFCGATNFGLPFWEGLESLALTYPVIGWLSRALVDGSREAAVTRAITMVDHNFGFNRLLGTQRQRVGLRIMAGRGEIDRLIAWYSR